MISQRSWFIIVSILRLRAGVKSHGWHLDRGIFLISYVSISLFEGVGRNKTFVLLLNFNSTEQIVYEPYSSCYREMIRTKEKIIFLLKVVSSGKERWFLKKKLMDDWRWWRMNGRNNDEDVHLKLFSCSFLFQRNQTNTTRPFFSLIRMMTFGGRG